MWPPPTATLFPYTTLFRSHALVQVQVLHLKLHQLAHADAGAVEDLEHRLVARAQEVAVAGRSEEHTSELQSRLHLVCRLLLEKKQLARCRKLPEPPPPRKK